MTAGIWSGGTGRASDLVDRRLDLGLRTVVAADVHRRIENRPSPRCAWDRERSAECRPYRRCPPGPPPPRPSPRCLQRRFLQPRCRLHLRCRHFRRMRLLRRSRSRLGRPRRHLHRSSTVAIAGEWKGSVSTSRAPRLRRTASSAARTASSISRSRRRGETARARSCSSRPTSSRAWSPRCRRHDEPIAEVRGIDIHAAQVVGGYLWVQPGAHRAAAGWVSRGTLAAPLGEHVITSRGTRNPCADGDASGRTCARRRVGGAPARGTLGDRARLADHPVRIRARRCLRRVRSPAQERAHGARRGGA